MWNDRLMVPAQSTQKSFDVLRALAAHGAAGASLADIADAVALPKPTVHRLLAAMVQQGFALRAATGRRYQLGPEIYALALKSQSTVGLVETWRGALMRVAERTGDSAFLMVRSGYDAVCLAMQEGVVSVRTLTGGTGGRVPANRLRSCVRRTSMPTLSTCELKGKYVFVPYTTPTGGGAKAAH